MSSSAPGGDEVDLARGAVAAPVQLAAKHEAGAEPGAHREEHEVFDAPRHPAPALADGGEVDVVLDADGQLEPAAEVAAPVAPFEAGDVGRERQAAGVGVDDAGNADDDAVDPVGGEAARLGERDAKRRRSPRSRPRRRRPSSSTSWRARISPRRSQIAPRRKRAPRSSPSTSPASGTTSKKVAP